VESKWKNYHIIAFPGVSVFKTETKTRCFLWKQNNAQVNHSPSEWKSYFSCLGSMTTNDTNGEIKSRIAMAKAALKNSKKALFTGKLGLNLRKKLVKCYIWSIE
jgi:hypothetical protein